MKKLLFRYSSLCLDKCFSFDYASVIWNPYKEKYNEQIEKIQRRATKTLPNLKHLSYVERLKKLKLPCLKYRRIRGDLI